MSLGTGRLNPYAAVDLYTLTNILMSPGNRPDVYRDVLSAFARVHPDDRRTRLGQILLRVVEHAGRYDLDVMTAVIDLLATDPDPKATATMLEAVPVMLQAGADRDTLVSDGFREYFYQALLTRRRDEDRDIWMESINSFSGDVWMAMLLDPVAQELVKALKPLERIDHLPRKDRNRTLRTLLMSGLSGSGAGHTIEAIKLMLRGEK